MEDDVMGIEYKILIIIVLYKCKLRDSLAFTALKPQTEESGEAKFGYYIHDNSPESDPEALEMVKANPSFFYTQDALNPGLSVAYNNAARYARKAGFRYLLISDQDTSWSDGFIGEMLHAVTSHPEIKLFAPILRTDKGMPISPTRYWLKRGHCCHLIPGIYSLKKYSPVNSGLLIDLASFLEVGGYNEKVRLDFSDFQFIEKFCKKHDSFCVIPSRSVQDFSGDVVDVEKQQIRYKIFCESVYWCTRNNIWDESVYFLIVLKTGIHLACRTKKVSFLRLFYSEYLKKK